jgi:hypothetical protein
LPISGKNGGFVPPFSCVPCLKIAQKNGKFCPFCENSLDYYPQNNAYCRLAEPEAAISV